jgi:glucose/arabinose dehydrogenase
MKRAWLPGIVLLVSCSRLERVPTECDAQLKLPRGFCARVFADQVGVARHIAVAANGDVYVALEDGENPSAGTTHMRGEKGKGGVLVLRDTTGDGRADVTVRFGTEGGSGLALRNDTLFFSSPTTVYRFHLKAAGLGPIGSPEIVVRGLRPGGHSSRSLALGPGTALFVNVGSDGNACVRGGAGEDPCSELAQRAGIWRFRADAVNQSYESGVRFATGIRNAVGLTYNAALQGLFATQHGRDALNRFRQFSAQDNDDLPAEEFMRVQLGDDFGWPYCFYDWRAGKKVLAPEYGGDGDAVGRCADKKLPLIGFPGHWAPDGLVFYDGGMFPERYRGGAFIAFHGSWNRRRQDGYKVVYVPFADGTPGKWEVFADGFAGRRKGPGSARHRPVGLAIAPDGSMYITDDQAGRIWNVRYVQLSAQPH